MFDCCCWLPSPRSFYSSGAFSSVDSQCLSSIVRNFVLVVVLGI